ncbi:DUF368 domain-containing protein [Jeotgalibaca sp. MA1X17-3]|uniref:DUF368 domain-containing protein n=1 Tax=Jeotgalibaca sp. MA1X17-3 TaxID=2908211 RepID=UPI001F3335A6|nr:DUF368 domain-containing protein [Jeotgalibaca sp. MA1X17-3]UJF15164.1 DUF368 domain-containing protein [Jeotgalibaca sp. MA1X17-3]
MNYLWLTIKGMLIGIANIIPGVSGGTMAISLGVYDDLIFSIANLLKDWKNSLRILAPIIIGLAGGIVAFSYLIELLLSQYTLPTALAFIGLILGGIPILWSSLKESLRTKQTTLSFKHLLVFLVSFALVAGMALIQESDASLSSFDFTFSNVILLFFIGVIASATMVIPGVSGSLVLMVLGFYYNILNTVTDFANALRTLDFNGLLYGVGLLLPFGIGILLGIFFISKLVSYLFKNLPVMTYSAILGLVLASPLAILINTNALNRLEEPNGGIFIIIGIVLLIGFAYVTYVLGKTDEPKKIK